MQSLSVIGNTAFGCVSDKDYFGMIYMVDIDTMQLTQTFNLTRYFEKHIIFQDSSSAIWLGAASSRSSILLALNL